MEELLVVKNDMFVEPHFIESLACDGLTDVEVAQSLEIDVRDVRKKLREGFIHTMESFGFSWVEPLTLKNINGVEYKAYSMSTECAQFFVGN